MLPEVLADVTTRHVGEACETARTATEKVNGGACRVTRVLRRTAKRGARPASSPHRSQGSSVYVRAVGVKAGVAQPVPP